LKICLTLRWTKTFDIEAILDGDFSCSNRGNMKRVLSIICIVSLIISCAVATTKPNISAIYRISALKNQLQPLPVKSQPSAKEPLPREVQTLFQQLYTIDSTLALEVGKLPEFQGKVDERQIRALTRFTELIANATTEEKANLALLLKEGRPTFRRYCTPLQAIFWLLEEDECLLGTNLLQYPLKDILVYAWDFTDQDRWGSYKIVTERLNSPELINYYERCNFIYVSHGECRGYAKIIFKSKKGCCSDFTAFSEYCLRKAGYEAMAIQVESPTYHSYHVVCEYEENGKKYIMDNSCRSCGSGKGITEKKEYTKKLPQIGFGYM